jgi:hypothetical protein
MCSCHISCVVVVVAVAVVVVRCTGWANDGLHHPTDSNRPQPTPNDSNRQTNNRPASLNGDSAYSLVRALLPGMAARKKGFVLLISSLITKMPHATLSLYYLEKAKINALANVLQVRAWF